jgi:ABC-type uncharacterized transport system permease subunit
MATATIGVRERMAAASRRIARVKLVDRAATGVITSGGVFIILSVLFIFIFIFAEAMPLFRGAKGEKRATLTLAAPGSGNPQRTPLAVGVDEYQKYLYEVTPDARVVVFRLADGARHRELAVPGLEGATVTAALRSLAGDRVALGTSDGRVALAQVFFRPVFEEQTLKDLEIGLRPKGVSLSIPGERFARPRTSRPRARRSSPPWSPTTRSSSRAWRRRRRGSLPTSPRSRRFAPATARR